MELNPVSSRKMNNPKNEGAPIRLPSRDGKKESNSLQSSTQDSFFRKSGKGFSSNRTENYGILKSDLFQLQEMINENSYLTKMYKITSKSPSFTKRLSEIEESKDIKYFVEKIAEEAANVERTGKIFNCTNTTELIQKLSLDVFYYELLLKKLNEYFLVLHLKIGGDDNLYQETFSKFFIIKLAVEKLLEKSYNNNSENISQNENTGTNYSVNINSNTNVFMTNNLESDSTSNQNDEMNKLLEINSLNEIIKLNKNSDSVIMNHLSNIINNFLEKINQNYNDLIQRYSNSNKLQNGLSIESFLTQKLLIEKIISDKDKENEKLKKSLNELNEKYTPLEDKMKSFNKLNEKNLELEEKIKLLKEELEKLKNENNEINESKNIEVIYNSDNNNQSLKKLIEETNKTITHMRSHDDGSKSKLYDEIKDLSTKLGEMNDKYSLLKQENEELNKKITFLNRSLKKDIDFDSYVQLMQEQFDTMKDSFVKKIEQLNEEMNQIKIESRRKVNDLQEDLTQTTYIKDIFLKQITELQKKIPDNN